MTLSPCSSSRPQIDSSPGPLGPQPSPLAQEGVPVASLPANPATPQVAAQCGWRGLSICPGVSRPRLHTHPFWFLSGSLVSHLLNTDNCTFRMTSLPPSLRAISSFPGSPFPLAPLCLSGGPFPRSSMVNQLCNELPGLG